jgi:hypothetical protein
VSILFGRQPLAFLPAEDSARQELTQVLVGFPSTVGARAAVGDRIRILSRDWHRDPETGLEVPRVHWSWIDYREPRLEGGIRRLWYAARHLDVPDLALDYYLTGDERAAGAALAPIVSWITQCPPGIGIHWSVPLEMGLRLTAWSYAIRLLAASPALAPVAPAIARSVHAQAEQILAYRARFSSANNHLIAQAAGLLQSGFAFSGLKGAPRWRRIGGEILWAEVLEQSTSDGVSREASLHYQEFVLELALLAWLTLRANGTEPPPAARTRIAAMLEVLAQLDAFPGGAPDFGDSDGQSALPFRGEASHRRTLLALGSVLCGQPEWKAHVRSLPRPAAILLGAPGRQAFAELQDARPAAGSRVFLPSGMALFRDASGDRGLWFDASPLGYLATAAHGHADCLALALGGFGQPLLIDPGTFSYHAEPRLRNHFRSTAAHNTLRIDGEDQSEMRGAFLWGRRARPQVEVAVTRAAWDLVVASHDGYERLPDPVRHRRWIVFVKPDYFWVLDEVDGTKHRHLIESFWHLAPGSAVVREGTAIAVRAPGGAELTLLQAGDPFSEVELWEGAEHPLQGWCSPAFGVRIPAPVLRLVADREPPCRFALVLRPRARSGGSPTGAVAVGRAALGPGEAFWARGMPGEDLLLRHGATGTVDLGTTRVEVALAGRAALVRLHEGQIMSVAGYGLEKLAVNGEVLVEVESGSVDFCLRRVGEHAVVEGAPSRVGLRIPGVNAVRGPEGTLPAERRGGALWLSLGSGSPLERC